MVNEHIRYLLIIAVWFSLWGFSTFFVIGPMVADINPNDTIIKADQSITQLLKNDYDQAEFNQEFEYGVSNSITDENGTITGTDQGVLAGLWNAISGGFGLFGKAWDLIKTFISFLQGGDLIVNSTIIPSWIKFFFTAINSFISLIAGYIILTDFIFPLLRALSDLLENIPFLQ